MRRIPWRRTPTGDRLRPVWPLALLGAAVLAIGLIGHSASGVTHLKPGDSPPPVELSDLDGQAFNLAKLNGRIVVLVFGELYHTRSRTLCERLGAVLKDPRLADQDVAVVLIVAQNEAPERLKAQLADGPWPGVVVHDRARRTFGAYQVAVLPTAVVIDRQGRVVHALAGLTDRTADLLTDALLVAAGKLSPQRFAEALHPQPTTAPSEEHQRAERIAQLAAQLVRRGMEELAAEKFAEALALDPDHESARVGLGTLLLGRRRLADAEVQFQAVLQRRPDSLEASLGLAFVQTQRGGQELADAEQVVRRVLARRPSYARAHYLMGLIHEKRNQLDQAVAAYKRAAELLMEQSEHGG